MIGDKANVVRNAAKVTATADIRVLVADDHNLVRETIAAFLQAEGIGEVRLASTLDEAVALARMQGGFDLVLLDYDMPGMDGLEGLPQMIAANRKRPVALMSGMTETEVIHKALALGAAGFVPKTLGAKSIVAAIRFMVAGEVFAPLTLLNKRSEAAENLLSAREMEVLRGICEGKSNKEIANDHDLQEVTVKLHVKTMCRKLGAKNRTHAAMIARDRKLV